MLSVALAAIALGAVTVAPASAATGNDIVEIKNVAYGECLQAGQEPHASPVVVACSGASSQRWEVIPVDGGRQLLRNLASRECLSEMFAAYYCDDQGVDEFAAVLPHASGAVRIKFGDGDRYLTGFTWSDGRRDAWYPSFREHDEQLWQVRNVGTTPPPADTAGQVVRIRAVNFVEHGCISLTSGTRLVPVPCADSPEQKFQRVELGDGRTAFRSVVNDKCVAVRETQPMDLEVVSDCAPDNVRQQWSIEPTRTGAARIRQAAGDQLLTPGSGWVFLYPRQSYTWQLWELLPA